MVLIVLPSGVSTSLDLLLSPRYILKKALAPLGPGLMEYAHADVAGRHELVQARQHPILVRSRIVTVKRQDHERPEREPFPVLGLFDLGLSLSSGSGGLLVGGRIGCNIFGEVDGTVVGSGARAEQMLLGGEGFELAVRVARSASLHKKKGTANGGLT